MCVTTKPRDIRQLASECSQIMAGVCYVVTLATQGFFPPFWCKWKFFTLKIPGFHAPLVLKTLLHGKKVPKLASRALACANSQVGAPSRKLARANSEVGASSPDLARAKCPPTDPTIDLHTIVVIGNSVPHLPLPTWHEESIVPSFFVECAKECVKQCARDVLPDDESSSAVLRAASAALSCSRSSLFSASRRRISAFSPAPPPPRLALPALPVLPPWGWWWGEGAWSPWRAAPCGPCSAGTGPQTRRIRPCPPSPPPALSPGAASGSGGETPALPPSSGGRGNGPHVAPLALLPPLQLSQSVNGAEEEPVVRGWGAHLHKWHN